jgi:transposase
VGSASLKPNSKLSIMGNFINAIGIDVSKKTLDVYDYAGQLAWQVSNSKEGFKELFKWAKRNNSSISEVLICLEHTGMYSLPLAVYLTEQKCAFAMLPGLEIKRSVGIQRGKSDKADAQAIARYAYLHRDEVRIYKLPSERILELKSLLSLRERMVGQRAGYQATRREAKAFGGTNSKLILDIQNKLIKELNAQIKRVEQQIKQVIISDTELKKIYDLVTSVKGVGLILGTTMMVYTNCFSTFDDWRKFACYCGIVPFPFQSGTSIRGKKKIHHLANKRLKALLSNAACSSIQFNPEMKAYYQRRLQEGKNKMSTQNIIRNKIVARIFAAVQRGTPYVDTFRHAA